MSSFSFQLKSFHPRTKRKSSTKPYVEKLKNFSYKAFQSYHRNQRYHTATCREYTRTVPFSRPSLCHIEINIVQTIWRSRVISSTAWNGTTTVSTFRACSTASKAQKCLSMWRWHRLTNEPLSATGFYSLQAAGEFCQIWQGLFCTLFDSCFVIQTGLFTNCLSASIWDN